MRLEKGFTLIEVMIVVAIIAILSTLSMTIYLDSVSKSQLTEAFSVTDGIKGEVSDYFLQRGTCPSLGQSTGFPSTAESYGGKYVASVSISPGTNNNCFLTVAMRGAGSVTPKLIGKTITLTMNAASSTEAVWTCASTADPKYLPTTCR